MDLDPFDVHGQPFSFQELSYGYLANNTFLKAHQLALTDIPHQHHQEPHLPQVVFSKCMFIVFAFYR